MQRDLTPAMRQYLEIKGRYPDCILFFRMGDFYEMFFEDAVLASQILEIALTTREKGKERPIPMCGVPYHAAAPYIAKLIEHGHKVALCEQVEDPRQARGIVRREVVRVITPGMVVEEENLPEGENNYLMSLFPDRGGFGLCFFDLSTGEFKGCLLQDEDLLGAEIRRNRPKEALLPEGEEGWGRTLRGLVPSLLVNFRPVGDFVPLPDPSIPEGLPEALGAAAAAVLHYVRSTQRERPGHIRPLSPYEVQGYLVLDETTQRNLELFETSRGSGTSLFRVLDRTATSMGRRRLRQWLNYPLRDVEAIRRRQEAVEELKERPFEREGLKELLKGMVDLERLSARLALRRANPRDLVALKETLSRLPGLRSALGAFEAPLLREILLKLDPSEEVVESISRALVEDPPAVITEGGIIRDGYHRELDELRAISREGKGWIARLEARERQRTGIQNLKVGYNQVFGYYIEVTRANLHLVPPDYIRKQTLTGAERFVTPELKEYENKVLGAEERIKALEYRLFCDLREELASEVRRFQGIADGLSSLDCLLSLAEVASSNDYVRPEVDEGPEIRITEGRHPVLEVTLPEPFVPNDTLLDEENQLLIITGPNMAGKSTYIRQVALIVIMAQMGSFVPAREARVGVVDRVFTRVGASDDISRGESTFMVEMKETATILKEATPRSLVILDEIGRGTSTYDGLSIAWAVAEHLHDVNRSKTLFATHYHELTELASSKRRVKNYHIAVKELRGEVVFLRELRPGGTSRSYGIQVARLAGLPREVIERAKEVLLELEGEGMKGPRFIKRGEPWQLPLFAPRESEVLKELREIDPDGLTPLQALELLYRWKKLEDR